MVRDPPGSRRAVSEPPAGPDRAPLIVTATLPPDLFAWADGLRRTHYPAERNVVPAHVTLFHALPPSVGPELVRLLARLCGDHGPVPAEVCGLHDLGRGTAIALVSPGLLSLRERIAEHCHGLLTAQDQGVPRLHVTIQNKVTPAAARALQEQVRGAVPHCRFAFAGLALHRYRGGPWEGVGRWSFRGKRGG